MKFLIKQKIFSFSDDFTIKDEYETEHFRIKGKVFSFGNKLRMFDMQENELFYIEQKLLRFLPEYTIYEGNEIAATVKREFTFFRPKFNIMSKYGSFTIDGNFLGMEFSVYNSGQEVARISKRWFSFSDTYGVDIYSEKDYSFLLCLVIVIDQVIHDGNKNH
jgi:uncharacterized protein YxjI